MKKFLVATTLAVIMMLVFAAPVFADQPSNPGGFGEAVATEAQNNEGPGLSPEVVFTKEFAAGIQTTFGQCLHFYMHALPEIGIPPKHTP